jgi:hypothetical protein
MCRKYFEFSGSHHKRYESLVMETVSTSEILVYFCKTVYHLENSHLHKTLSLLKCPLNLLNSKQWGGCVTVLPEFLEFYLLLYAAYW